MTDAIKNLRESLQGTESLLSLKEDELVAYLRDHTHVDFVPLVEYADYYPRAAGSKPGARALEAARFEERISTLVADDPELGEYVRQLKRREFAQ